MKNTPAYVQIFPPHPGGRDRKGASKAVFYHMLFCAVNKFNRKPVCVCYVTLGGIE